MAEPKGRLFIGNRKKFICPECHHHIAFDKCPDCGQKANNPLEIIEKHGFYISFECKDCNRIWEWMVQND